MQFLILLEHLYHKTNVPATHRQESYAKTISETLRIELTDEILKTVESCSAFIEHSNNYREYKRNAREEVKRNRMNISQARRVDRWLLAKESLKAGMDIEDVSILLDVKPPTIEKYCLQLEVWVNETITTYEYDIVMALVEKTRKGEDIYENYEY